MKDIEKWLNSKKQDYHEGVALFSRYGKNNHLKRFFTQRESPARKAKLIYELTKLAVMKQQPVPEKVPQSGKAPAKTTEVVKPAQADHPETNSKTPFNKLPLIIQEVIKQKGNLYREREQLHEQLKVVPQDNTPASVQARKPLVERIDRITARIDELYGHQQAFEQQGTIPDEKALQWDPQPAEKPDANMPDHDKMSDLELKSRLTNLRSYISKDENRLKYQDARKLEKENPIPEGPRRTQLEKKIALRKAEIARIEEILAERAKSAS